MNGPVSGGLIAEARSRRPLVHVITNLVSMAACAQVVKALGASTIFAHVPEEAAEIAAAADAVVINIGTSVPGLERTAVHVAEVCAARQIPLVLDPLGVGASQFRSALTKTLLGTGAVRVVSGNAAELAALCGVDSVMRGADSISTAATPETVCRTFATASGVIAAVSGSTDYVSDGGRVVGIANGHPVMGQVVGTGSARSAALGVFAAVAGEDLFGAIVGGVCAYNIAGELAAASGRGPGYLLPELYNALSAMDDERAMRRARVTAPVIGGAP